MVVNKFKILLFLFYFIIKTETNEIVEKPNVCNDFMSYYTMDPKNCWYNPDVFLPGPDIVLRHNYPLEVYNVTTKDEYIITMFRLPKRNRKGIIYLQSPFMTNFVIWVDKGNHSLAFMLWDAGYEVWLGNFRENVYGKRHKYYKPDTKEFWNFSFHENAIYDIPAQVDFIVRTSKAKPQELTYIGHSMSGTTGIVYASLFPDESSKIFNLFVIMAPTAFVKNLLPLYYSLSTSVEELKKLHKYLDIYEYTGWNFVFNLLSLCRSAPFMVLCIILDNVAFGNVAEDHYPPWIPLKFAHNPDSIPVNTMVHYGQMAESRRFQMYDYGKEKNLEVYGSEIPPLYPVQNISVPIYLMYTDNDVLIAKQDIEFLYENLQDKAKIYGKCFIKHMAHTSFLYGTRVKELVYTPILELIDKVTKKRNGEIN